MPVIPAPKGQRQEDHNFEAILANICSQKQEWKHSFVEMIDVNTELLQLMLLLGK